MAVPTPYATLRSTMAPDSQVGRQQYACAICVQRKVKCDKRQPCCSACSRSSLPCRYRSSPPSQRRKRKAFSAITESAGGSRHESHNHAHHHQNGLNQALLERLRAHEATMRSAGIQFQSFGNDLNYSHFPDNHPHHLEGDQQNEENDVAAQENIMQQRHISNKSAIPTHVKTNTSQPHALRFHRGTLIPEYGGKRYYDHGFIGIMGQEYRQNLANQPKLQRSASGGPLAMQTEATSDLLTVSVLTNIPSSTTSVPRSSHEHPLLLSVAEKVKFWDVFVENVHPLTKIVHAPSMWQLIFDEVSNVPNNSTNSNKTDALLYAICACAVSSVAATECERVFKGNQLELLNTFQSAARNVLFEACLLKVPDLDLLRAHVLLLTSMLHNSEAYPLWNLMGTTIRLAQSQGLHRDGTNLGLPPFEVEMRRRLWWYIVTLDARLTEIIGGESSVPKSMDASLPSNLNDDDLSPATTCYPHIQTGASEMTFCLVRYEIARFQYERELPRANYPRIKGVERGSLSGLESVLEQKYLRFCDPVVPLQLLATTTARSTLCKLKQMAIHSISRSTPEEGHVLHPVDAEQNRRKTFSLATRNVQYDNLIHSTRSQGKYLWFVNFHIPWGGPVYVLKALAYRPDWNSDMEAAWEQIEELYDHHPEYLEHNKDIYQILRGLTLKAWSARESVLKAKRLTVLSQVHTPVFVTAIKARDSEHGEPPSLSSNRGIPPHEGALDPASVTSGLEAISSADIELLDPLFASGEWTNWSAY